jgi:hypothetical protein
MQRPISLMLSPATWLKQSFKFAETHFDVFGIYINLLIHQASVRAENSYPHLQAAFSQKSCVFRIFGVFFQLSEAFVPFLFDDFHPVRLKSRGI